MDADHLIVGAGCAGLSLAVRLAERGLDGRRVILVDPREGFSRDRTWCFFRVADHPFEDAVSHRWHRWKLTGGAGEIIRGSDRHPYEHLPSEAFYRRAQEMLEPHPGVRFDLGTAVTEIRDEGASVVVETDRGMLRASTVFDSRPPTLAAPAPSAEVRLLQHFRGWFVRTGEASFDPSLATLMDFSVPQDPGVHFVYVLPFSETEALVEDTFFTEGLLDGEVYERYLHEWLETNTRGGWEITGTEGGVIPMTTETFDPRPSQRVYRIGTAAGAARPSTGYAFLAIQRQAEALAQALSRTELPRTPSFRSPRTLFLDRVFLSYLAKNPTEGPNLFLRLFEKGPPDVVVRFLSETSSVAEDIRIMQTLPTLPFAAETFLANARRLRPA